MGVRRAWGALLALALLLPLAVAVPAHAAPALDPHADTEIVVTLLQQPASPGPDADGTPVDEAALAAMTPIAGARFEARLVPGIDLATNEGQRQAAALTVAEALARTAGEPVGDAGVTGTDGVTRLGGANGRLGVGLYLVQQTDAAAGAAASAPFLVALPRTNPAGDGWLYTVHVYPKSAAVGIVLDVDDADALTLGETVWWTSRSQIPPGEPPSGYLVQNLVAPGLEPVGAPEATLRGAGAEALAAADTEVRTVTVEGRTTIEVAFTASGLAKLQRARAADPAAEVAVRYGTRVLAEGVHVNEARVFADAGSAGAARGAAPSLGRIGASVPNGTALAGITAPAAADLTDLTATATTKWGSLAVLVHERGNPDNPIAGARFALYRSEDDAVARRDAIVIGGVGEWSTDAQGMLTIEGLRFSNFANGLERERGDALYQPYWVLPTFAPAGWTWVNPLPMEVAVGSVVAADAVVFAVQQAHPLPMTGGQVAGGAILLALVLGGGGMLLLGLHRRRTAARPQREAAAPGQGGATP